MYQEGEPTCSDVVFSHSPLSYGPCCRQRCGFSPEHYAFGSKRSGIVPEKQALQLRGDGSGGKALAMQCKDLSLNP